MPFVDDFAAWLHATTLATTLRASIWLYPLVNTAHVLGIALLVGAIVPLDLRLAGAFAGAPVAALARVLVPTAVAGLLLAVASGTLLFATKPLDYVVEPLFGVKLALVGTAVLNALLLRRSPAWQALQAGADAPAVSPPAWRVAALVSLALWLAVVTAGRLIGYR